MQAFAVSLIGMNTVSGKPNPLAKALFFTKPDNYMPDRKFYENETGRNLLRHNNAHFFSQLGFNAICGGFFAIFGVPDGRRRAPDVPGRHRCPGQRRAPSEA